MARCLDWIGMGMNGRLLEQRRAAHPGVHVPPSQTLKLTPGCSRVELESTLHYSRYDTVWPILLLRAQPIDGDAPLLQCPLSAPPPPPSAAAPRRCGVIPIAAPTSFETAASSTHPAIQLADQTRAHTQARPRRININNADSHHLDTSLCLCRAQNLSTALTCPSGTPYQPCATRQGPGHRSRHHTLHVQLSDSESTLFVTSEQAFSCDTHLRTFSDNCQSPPSTPRGRPWTTGAERLPRPKHRRRGHAGTHTGTLAGRVLGPSHSYTSRVMSVCKTLSCLKIATLPASST